MNLTLGVTLFARLFADTLEQMLEAELSEHLGYEPYEAKGRNRGNNRNGRYPKKVRTSGSETTIQVPRDRNGEFEPQIVAKYAANTNELEEKIISMCAKGMPTRDDVTPLKWIHIEFTMAAKVTPFVGQRPIVA